jgi:hypothetical protein
LAIATRYHASRLRQNPNLLLSFLKATPLFFAQNRTLLR